MRVRHIVFLFAACVAANELIAGGISQTVALSETPAAVQKTIQAHSGDGTLGEIDKIQEDGLVTYDVELTAKDGSGRDFTVDENGTLLSVEVALADTPVAVQKSIQNLMSQGKLESIDKNLDDSEVTYDVELTTKDNLGKGVTIADDGSLLSAEVSLSETPEPVRKAIVARLGDSKLETIAKNSDDDGTSYDVEVTTKDGRKKGFTLAASGSLLSEQVMLQEIPRAVRRKVKGYVGNGKLLRIDKSFVKERGVLPYIVEARKDGKRFDFIVGPRGRFLGMDE